MEEGKFLLKKGDDVDSLLWELDCFELKGNVKFKKKSLSLKFPSQSQIKFSVLSHSPSVSGNKVSQGWCSISVPIPHGYCLLLLQTWCPIWVTWKVNCMRNWRVRGDRTCHSKVQNKQIFFLLFNAFTYQKYFPSIKGWFCLFLFHPTTLSLSHYSKLSLCKSLRQSMITLRVLQVIHEPPRRGNSLI